MLFEVMDCLVCSDVGLFSFMSVLGGWAVLVSSFFLRFGFVDLGSPCLW